MNEFEISFKQIRVDMGSVFKQGFTDKNETEAKRNKSLQFIDNSK